jgi:hypothetical protein
MKRMTHILSDRETSRQERQLTSFSGNGTDSLQTVMRIFIESLVNKLQKYALRKFEEHRKEF